MVAKVYGLGTARASPINDAQAHRPTPAISGQGLPCQVRARLKTLVPQRKLRFATWNIGSLTGRCRELADVLMRRRVQCAFLQETRWKGNKSRNIGQGYRLIYTGSPSGKAGVAVVLSEELRNGLLEVDRRCDRLMRVRVLIEGVITNLISAYTPQAGCSGSEKESFWEQFEEVLRAIPAAEVIIVGGDLNGHVGRAAETFDRVHGGFGYGRRNAEGENILRTCIASDLAVVNTFFQKTPQHLITYKSGSHSTQIDYLLTRRCHISKVTNCKVIPGESLTAQHRLLVMDYVVTPKKKVAEKRKPRIRWWLLNGTMQTSFRAEVESQNLSTNTETAQEVWDRAQSAIITAGKRVLGLSKGGRVIDKETWWWNDEVQEVIREKKTAFKKWQQSNSPEDRLEYIAAKRASKRAVARARSDRLSPLYDTLETAEGQKLST
nr:craniofacial development protein 2-like [Danaus plexippus plexippus]